MVQLDGMHTQHETVRQILYEKGCRLHPDPPGQPTDLIQTAQQLLPADLPPCTGDDQLPGRTQRIPGDRTSRTIEPKELGLAGAVQIARIDRRIGAKGKLNRTWEVTSRSQVQQNARPWLAVDRQHWGIENRTHHTLDVTYREDESRVHHPNALSVLGIFTRVSNALKHLWAKGRPKREATSRDWIEENLFNRWKALRLIANPIATR